MKPRYMTDSIEELCFRDHKIAFISGPRQCGKTTLAKSLLQARGAGSYWNWDSIELRRLWAKDPSAVVPASSGQVPVVVLDEIHKARAWKRTLKGIYDTLTAPADILVTGSARLAVYRKGSDSLLGRYLPFRLHPFSVRELERPDSHSPDLLLDALFGRTFEPARNQAGRFEALMEFGPFPEPVLAGDARRARLWRRTRVEAIIRQDLRDLSRLPDLSRVEMLAALLPERVGSLVSVESLREDLEVAHSTVKRWLLTLAELYYAFLLRPYRTRIARSLRQVPKVYLWDWSEVASRPARFENLVAGHLLKACHFWTDTGAGEFDLFYLRTKEQRELDFLITRDGRPWLPVEAKLAELEPSPAFWSFLPMIGCNRGLQLVAEPGRWRLHEGPGGQVLVASASEALDYLV